VKAIRSWMIPAFTPNPILVKELRSRMRGPRAFITLTVALAIMALLMVAMTSLFTRAGNTFGSMLSPQIGQVLFEGLINFVLLLVCTVTPAVTAGAISSEREKLTFEMLLATPLGPAKILWGKLISALSYVFLLILAAIPLGSLVFLFGGVAPLAMLKALFILVVVAVTLGIYGLFLSALLGRTGRSTVVSFVTVMALLFAPLVGLVANGLFYSTRLILPRFILAFSPVSMLVSAVETMGSVNNGGVSSIFSFVGGQWDPSLNPVALTQIPRPIYHYSLALCGGLSIILFTLSIALINPARRFYLSKRTALTGGAVLAVFVAGVVAVYLLTAPRYEWIQATRAANQGQAGMLVTGPVVQAQAVAVGRAFAAPAPTALPPGAGGAYPAVTPTAITAQGAALGADMPLSEQIAIYAAAAHQVVLKDSTLGDPAPQFPVIYLVATTNDRVGAPDQPDMGTTTLSTDLQAGVSSALSDLPGRVVWVNSLDAVPKDAKDGAVQDGGLAITFGNIQVQADGSVQLPASVYAASLIGGGQTYRLDKDAGAWEVTGITGDRWIS
jgi:ABC-type transport system involved in multi-copper enzyme maturation permease subunit